MKPQLEYFAPDETARLRARTLLSKSEFSQAIRTGELRALEQHPFKGGGYPTPVLNALAAGVQDRIIGNAPKTAAGQIAATAMLLSRRDGRDTPDANDVSAARLYLRTSPERRAFLARGFASLNGGSVGMRLAASGAKSSFYRLP